MEIIIGIIIGSLIGIGAAVYMIKISFEKSKGLGFLFPKTPEHQQIIVNEQKKGVSEVSKAASFLSSRYSIILIVLGGVIFKIIDSISFTIAFGISIFVSWFITLLVVKIVYKLWWLSKKTRKVSS